jgi:hypothetical protein
MRFLVVLFLACLSAGRIQAQPQPAAGDDPYLAGLDCFDKLDFACAVDLLTAAAFATDSQRTQRWTDIHHKLAESHLALGHTRLAVEAFERLLEVAPDYQIDTPGTSPKILAALMEARQRLDATREQPVENQESAAEPPRPPSSLLPIQLGLSANAVLLVGQDRDLLEPGLALDVVLSYRYSEHWQLGGGLRWATHALEQGGDSLNLIAGWAGAGPTVALGPLQLTGMIGMGVAGFGILGQEGKSALMVPAQVFMDWRLQEHWAVGLTFSPRWLLSFDDLSSSLTFDLGGRLLVAF